MKSSLGIALFIPLIVVPWQASAQMFQCKDASGRSITSDRPIPECAYRPMRELSTSGMPRREIPAPMTVEERRKMQEQEEKRKAEAIAAEEQRRNDLAIRARFRSEADIEAARKRSLEPVEEQIKREKLTLANAEKQQKAAQSEVDAFKAKSAPVPTIVQRKLDDADHAVEASQKLLRDQESELVQINAKYEATLNRYRELVGPVAAK